MPEDPSLIPFPEPATERELEIIRPSEVNPGNLTQYTEQWLAGVAGDVLREVKKSVMRRLKKDDPKATQQAGEMLGLLRSSGATVINNVMQASITGVNADSFRFESIIRQMEEHDRPSGQVVDVTPERP